jgi:hypothetical protein
MEKWCYRIANEDVGLLVFRWKKTGTSGVFLRERGDLR